MLEPLDKLPTSLLRKLLVDEVKLFAESIDVLSEEELQVKKDRLTAINKLITEKERQEINYFAEFPPFQGRTRLPGHDPLDMNPSS